MKTLCHECREKHDQYIVVVTNNVLRGNEGVFVTEREKFWCPHCWNVTHDLTINRKIWTDGEILLVEVSEEEIR